MFILDQRGERVTYIGPSHRFELYESNDGKYCIMALIGDGGGSCIGEYSTKANALRTMKKLLRAVSGTRCGFQMPQDKTQQEG